MSADCHQRKQKEQELGKSSHSTEILLEDGQSFDEFLESLNITYEPPAHMTVRLKIGGKLAKTLLDTGTVGTNLMSLNWAQSNEIKITKMDNPIEIRMATKNSRTKANYSAKKDVDIGNGKRISCEFLLVPVGSYNVILGMPFMIKTNATLRPGNGTATFGNSQTTISCAPTEPIYMAAPIMIIDSPQGSLSSLDENDEYHDLFPQDEDSERLQHIDLIRHTATAAIETVQEPQWNEKVYDHARQMIVYAACAYQKQIPNFKEEFPSVFPEKIPETLPPLRKGLNHKIMLKESELGNYRNKYCPIPESKMKQLNKWLQEWKENGIAVNGPAPYATPIFGVPNKAPGEIRWVIDLKIRNRYTIRDYMPIPNQPIIRNDVASHPFRSKIDMSNAYYQIRVEPADEIKNSITAGQFGAFQVEVMLQGDCNAPATDQKIPKSISGASREHWLQMGVSQTCFESP